MDKTDYEGSDAESEGLSDSPEPSFVAKRGGGASGAGVGPVRFGTYKSDGEDEVKFLDDSENGGDGKIGPKKNSKRVPLSHEAEISHSRRMLGEPPNWHNPRALVSFCEAKHRVPEERFKRKENALKRAGEKGWVPTRAPEWNNPNGTGKAVKVPKERSNNSNRPGRPTVAFEEEFEQFKMLKLREKAHRAGDLNSERFTRGDYAPVSSDDDGSVGQFGAEEQTEESEGEMTIEEQQREAHVPGATSNLLKRHKQIREEFGRATSPGSPVGLGQRRKGRAEGVHHNALHEERSEVSLEDGFAPLSPMGGGQFNPGMTDYELDPTETEMARVFADGGVSEPVGADGRVNSHTGFLVDVSSTAVPTALRFALPKEPEPARNLSLWPTPFGRPTNNIPNRTVREDVGASYPVPPPEERSLPRYQDRNEGKKKGLAALSFARSVGTGTVGASGFSGLDGGHAPDPRFMRMNEGVETIGLGPLPPGFLASKEIAELATVLTKKGEYEGGGGEVDRAIISGRSADQNDIFKKRTSAARRAVSGNVNAGLNNVNPPGGSFMDLEFQGGEDELIDPDGGDGNETPAIRPPVTSGNQTMSLNAHAGKYE